MAHEQENEEYGGEPSDPEDDEDFCRGVVYERIALGGGHIAVAELNHLAWVLVHKVLEPEYGFGGCYCDTCSLLREGMKAIREKEAQEYILSCNNSQD